MDKMNLNGALPNYRKPSNMNELKSKMVDELLNNRKIRETMNELNVTQDELVANLGKFIRLLESYEECGSCDHDKCPFAREGMVPYLVRDEFNDLIIKYELCENAKIKRLVHLNYLIKDFDPMFDDYALDTIDPMVISSSAMGVRDNFQTLKIMGALSGKEVSRENNFIIFGKRGNGKTGYVAALTNRFVIENHKCAFVDVRKLIQILIAKIGMKENYTSILDTINNAEVLVLDNFGDEKISEWSRNLLSDIFSNRNRSDKMTIITTSHSWEDLTTLYSAIKGENFRANKIKADDFLSQVRSLMKKELYLKS